MTDRSSVIFGNKMPDKVYKKAVKSKKKYIKKFGDDSRKNYEVSVEKNRYIGDSLGVYNILVGNPAENAHYDVNAHAEKGTFDTEKGIIVGNIRMGFGHYRISMAMASAAKAMGYTPYWMDLNSYGETTCTKVIGAQNDLYSLGSRLSKNPIFNKLVWEPMNYEGFRALSYNAADQKNAEAGKDSARKELYTLYSKQMLAVCYRYTGDVDAAHDVLHDGFIKIFTHFTFRGECALSTWVTRVMVTQAIDYLRKQQRFSQLVVNEEQLPDIPDEAGIAETGGRISEEMLMAFVAELPDGCRTVFNLYVFEEKSHKEIAEILHIKEHSSTSQLHRAKCLLIKRIKEYTEYERK